MNGNAAQHRLHPMNVQLLATKVILSHTVSNNVSYPRKIGTKAGTVNRAYLLICLDACAITAMIAANLYDIS